MRNGGYTSRLRRSIKAVTQTESSASTGATAHAWVGSSCACAPKKRRAQVPLPPCPSPPPLSAPVRDRTVSAHAKKRAVVESSPHRLCSSHGRAYVQPIFSTGAASRTPQLESCSESKAELPGHTGPPRRDRTIVGDAAVTQSPSSQATQVERRELLASRSHRHHRFISDVAEPRQV